jgi:hypothetical protein
MSTQAHWAAALLDPNLPPPPGVLAWNGSDPAQRLGVYRNNVVVSLVDALACTLPVTQALVGEAFFRAMAQTFVCQEPPRHPVLTGYGEGFPSFVEQFPPAASVPYLADVARLEWLRLQVLHAADAQPLPLQEAQAWLVDPDCLAQQTCALVPALQTLSTQHAAVSIWAAHQPDSGLHLEDVNTQQAEAALVFRAGWDVMVLQVSPATVCFVAQLRAGHTWGDALDAAALTDPEWDAAQALVCLFQHALIADGGDVPTPLHNHPDTHRIDQPSRSRP